MSLNDEDYSILQTMRDKSDYNCSFDATEQLVEPLIEPTKQLIESVLKFVEE